MKLPFSTLVLLHSLTLTAGGVYSGFSYGNHWDMNTPRTYNDFKRAFETAKQIKGAPVTFNSARLFSCLQWNTKDPSDAFQAAIDTNTTLFLGIWIGHDPTSNTDNIETELRALDKAFEKHGQALVDLVVGISVGNEDIYRSTELCTTMQGKPCSMQATVEEVAGNLTAARNHLSQAPYADLLEGKPFGHVETAISPFNEGVDFVGMTAYPFWASVSVDEAKDSFMASLTDVQQKSGDKPVWIAETGWPISGPPRDHATTGKDQAQKYWTEIGCEVFGKYNVWWFELERDTYEGEYDWGIIDIKSRQSRIKDFSCPGRDPAPDDPEAVAPPSSKPSTELVPPSTLVTMSSNGRLQTLEPSNGEVIGQPKASTSFSASAPTPEKSQSTPLTLPHRKTVTVTRMECITVYRVGDGSELTLGTQTFFSSWKCALSPTITLDDHSIPLTRSTTGMGPIGSSSVAVASSETYTRSARYSTTLSAAPSSAAIVVAPSAPLRPTNGILST